LVFGRFWLGLLVLFVPSFCGTKLVGLRLLSSTRTYKLQFSRRKQLTGESVEKFAAELKRLYYKAYKNRDARTRQEDLLQRFLLGLNDYKARVHLELHRDPATIDDAVYEILTYMETMKNPNQLDEIKKSVRQIKNTPKDLIHGQLNGKKPVETRETEISNPVVTGGSGEQSKTAETFSSKMSSLATVET
jgi:hypothetical protein